MKYLGYILNVIGLFSVLILITLIVINTREYDAQMSEQDSSSAINFNVPIFDLVSNVLVASQSTITLNIVASDPKIGDGKIPISIELGVSSINKLIDTILKPMGDLVKDDCYKVIWTGPTKNVSTQNDKLIIHSKVKASIYEGLFGHCNFKIWGPDGKDIKITVSLVQKGNTINAVIHKIDIKRVSDKLEKYFGLHNAKNTPILTLVGLDTFVKGTDLKFSFSGKNSNIKLLVTGALLKEQPEPESIKRTVIHYPCGNAAVSRNKFGEIGGIKICP